MAALRRVERVRVRHDKWGGLAWTPGGPLFELSHERTAVLNLLEFSRTADDPRLPLLDPVLPQTLKALLDAGLISDTSGETVPVSEEEYLRVYNAVASAKRQHINKPFWVHIQPFTFCNQRCIHCYCHGGLAGTNFPLTIEEWKGIVDAISDFGVPDVYITGGENLISEDCFALTKYIIECGLNTGLSTNAMVITPKALDRISALRIRNVQVSLDGATEDTNDVIRGKRGAFRATVRGIGLLSEVATPIVNTVVNTLNLGEVAQIVRLGLSLGVCKFKFFPQKYAGRAKDQPHLLLTDDEIESLASTCRNLAAEHQVEIEYLDRTQRCGSAFSGFAIDEVGDVFPCIFGIADPKQRAGNALEQSIEDIWFASPVLESFRALDNRQSCRRCEDCSCEHD